MSDTLLRLSWALPLVLATGAVAMLALKRVVARAPKAPEESPRMTVRETLAVSEETRVHLVELNRQSYLLVESTRGTQLHAVPAQFGESSRAGSLPAWAQRLYKVKPR